MRLYETTFILNPQTDDATIDAQIKAVSDIITDNGGKIVHENRMGTRRLAYEIKKLTQGYYTTITFESEQKVLKPLDRLYRLGEEYIRDLTIIFEGNPDDIVKKDFDSHRDNKSGDDEKSKPDKSESHDGPKGRRETPKTAEPVVEEPVVAVAETVEPVVEKAAPVEPVVETSPVVEEPKKEEPSPENYDEKEEL